MSILDLLFYSFIIIILIQILFYGFVFIRFGMYKQPSRSRKNIGVSVLVCAKNESENLKAFIPSVLEQDFPQFELVLINDGSSDDTLNTMREFERQHKNVRVVDVKPIDSFWNNKKYPLTLGIKASKYDFLLFTDADCKPVSSNWIKEMSRHFSNDKTIVLGYGGYKKIKGSFLNLLIRYETVLTALQYFSFALLGSPYMGVGRNLAYRKDVFFNVGGFRDHMHINSGDDDLFINSVANSQNTEICYNPESFTESIPKKNFKSWFLQKRRHISTAKFYKTQHKLALGLFYLSQISFWLLGITLLLMGYNFKIITLLILLRFIVAMSSYFMCVRKLKSIDTLILFPLLEIVLILLQLVIFMTNLSSKSSSWK